MFPAQDFRLERFNDSPIFMHTHQTPSPIDARIVAKLFLKSNKNSHCMPTLLSDPLQLVIQDLFYTKVFICSQKTQNFDTMPA